MKKYINASSQIGYDPQFIDDWNSGKISFTKQMNGELKSIYEKKVEDPTNVLCGLAAISSGNNPAGVAYIAYHEQYGLNRDGLLAIVAGCGFGPFNFQSLAVDFLDEINYHTEANEIQNDLTKFACALLLNKFNS